VQQRVSELGLEGRIQLLGTLPHEKIVDLLASAHIYTQHSITAPNGDQEGQPVSLVEASAMGLPIISTVHSGIPEVVLDGETGYLVAEHDVKAMGNRIAEVARDPSLWTRLGEAGRSHIERNFSLERETAKAIAILHAASGYQTMRENSLA
jgi:colanic acid/amylovoran biosynthesis glycosyltransferase